MTLDVGTATAGVGAVALAVAGWGGWISIGSLRSGPGWARSRLSTWRPMPWVLAGLGAVAIALVRPVWVGLALVYIGVVTGWLLWIVRRNLDRVHAAYGEFDDVGVPFDGTRLGGWIMVTAVVLGAVAIWDVTERGWIGLFGLALAVGLGSVGIYLRRAN